jgi:hypothetical protein
MSDWKKWAITWSIGMVVGFYTVFVMMQFWNWFAVPLLGVPVAGYWVVYGLNMLLALFTGHGEPEDPTQEKRWRMLYTVLDACVLEQKMEEVREYVRGEGEQIWAEAGLHIFGVVAMRTLTLGVGFAVHLLV